MTTTTEGEALPSFWTLAEAAADLRVSTQTVSAAIRAGKLQAKKVGRSYRLKPAAVRAFADTFEDA